MNTNSTANGNNNNHRGTSKVVEYNEWLKEVEKEEEEKNPTRRHKKEKKIVFFFFHQFNQCFQYNAMEHNAETTRIMCVHYI